VQRERISNGELNSNSSSPSGVACDRRWNFERMNQIIDSYRITQIDHGVAKYSMANDWPRD
jgi:hypothetical protein